MHYWNSSIVLLFLTLSIMGSPVCEPWRWSCDIYARANLPWAMFDRVKHQCLMSALNSNKIVLTIFLFKMHQCAEFGTTLHAMASMWTENLVVAGKKLAISCLPKHQCVVSALISNWGRTDAYRPFGWCLTLFKSWKVPWNWILNNTI